MLALCRARGFLRRLRWVGHAPPPGIESWDNKEGECDWSLWGANYDFCGLVLGVVASMSIEETHLQYTKATVVFVTAKWLKGHRLC